MNMIKLLSVRIQFVYTPTRTLPVETTFRMPVLAGLICLHIKRQNY
jgi:hypothetical protein